MDTRDGALHEAPAKTSADAIKSAEARRVKRWVIDVESTAWSTNNHPGVMPVFRPQ